MMPWPLMNIPFPCGITLREITSGGQGFLVGETVLKVGYIQFGRGHPVMEPDLTFIIVLVRALIGMKELRIIMSLSGKSGIILFSLIRA